MLTDTAKGAILNPSQERQKRELTAKNTDVSAESFYFLEY